MDKMKIQILNKEGKKVKEIEVINLRMAKILKVIYEQGGGMTANKIAKIIDFSGITVRKYLRVAMKNELVITDKKIENTERKTRGKTIRYSLDLVKLYGKPKKKKNH